MSFIAKRVSPDNHVFYIHKLNLDFNLDDKSLEIDLAIQYQMEHLRDNINQLRKNTLKME